MRGGRALSNKTRVFNSCLQLWYREWLWFTWGYLECKPPCSSREVWETHTCSAPRRKLLRWRHWVARPGPEMSETESCPWWRWRDSTSECVRRLLSPSGEQPLTWQGPGLVLLGRGYRILRAKTPFKVMFNFTWLTTCLEWFPRELNCDIYRNLNEREVNVMSHHGRPCALESLLQLSERLWSLRGVDS